MCKTHSNDVCGTSGSDLSVMLQSQMHLGDFDENSFSSEIFAINNLNNE